MLMSYIEFIDGDSMHPWLCVRAAIDSGDVSKITEAYMDLAFFIKRNP